MNDILKNSLTAHYTFEDASNPGKDSSGNGFDAAALGTSLPAAEVIDGKNAVRFAGGKSGTSYLKLPSDVLKNVSDMTGITLSAWVRPEQGTNVWERLFNFGKGMGGPYIFVTRNLRTSCFAGEDIVADPVKALPIGQWSHIAVTVSGTKEGTLSSAGPIVYINGEVAADGSISQTTSGMYGKFRHFWSAFSNNSHENNFIGKSQYDVDDDFSGSMADIRIFSDVLSEYDILEVMCDSLSDEEIVNLAKEKYLEAPEKIAIKDYELPASLMGGKVTVTWKSDNESALTSNGKLQEISAPALVNLTAVLTKGAAQTEKNYRLTALPSSLAPYTLTVHGEDETVKVSDTLFGLFYEDINNAADGGIYAEMIQNRSFEDFTFQNYDMSSGENAKTGGRNHTPLNFWFGDTDKMTPKCSGGLNEFFGVTKPETAAYYVEVADGAVIYNRGFCDSNHLCSMNIISGEKYDFTIWAKGTASIELTLVDENGNALSDTQIVSADSADWKKYGKDTKIILTASSSSMGQLKMVFHGSVAIDMVSMFPEKVWGASEEKSSATAHTNYLGNPNYRLRADLVQALADLHPTFLRFPGGCISEGSYLWENVYDWKDSVGDVETRKENYNCWGYVMTMGLGYMEYFQLSEDLGATPLPVMACGVLCQARSDYANPAGGSLRDKYIKNFTDLIDFAISTDFENNVWAKVRKEMGHEAPFDLHYLGVGNENWGPEFMASFEEFYERITKHVKENYPGYNLTILSTAGAQADDNAYKDDWKFLAGGMEGSTTLSFTDGETSTEEEVNWYKYQKNFMETIVDEHYYRANNYLLNNVDRYNYYYRAYNADGTIDDSESSKVFVGEYASSDKNTLAGAVAEAAVMTGFENNSDVVRLAATAPLFNKILTDSTYRWTPDCIWFDNESVWYTPTYYVQQLFAKYIGKNVVSTSFETYADGKAVSLIPRGGIEIATANAEIIVKHVTVTSNKTSEVLFENDFSAGLPENFALLPNSGEVTFGAEGMTIHAGGTLSGIYCIRPDWTDYTVKVIASRVSGNDGFYVGVGVTDIESDTKTALEYAIAYDSEATGVKVYKNGVEGYRLGDFSSSSCAGNLRAASYEPISSGKDYTITVNYGADSNVNDSRKRLICSYTDGSFTSKVLDYKLEAYNHDIFNSVTKDEEHLYIKLVNADNFDKPVKLSIEDLAFESCAKCITITGDAAKAHVPNVNTKENEPIVPAESEITFTDSQTTIVLPANSVTAIIADRK